MELNEEFFLNFIYRVKRNQIRMLIDRGYRDAVDEFKDFEEEEPVDQYIIEKIKKGIENLDLSFFNRVYDNELVVLYLISNKKPMPKNLFIDIITQTKDRLEKDENIIPEHIILIINNPISKETKNTIKNLAYHIEIFMFEEMSYIPVDHFMCSKFELLKREDVLKFLYDNNISFDDLPMISDEDPIARYYGARIGDVFKIERNNLLFETFSEGNVTFRAVRNLSFIL